MDWNKDWLYRLIFKEVETFWNKFAARSVEQIHIAEYPDAELQKSYCKGMAMRHWVYSGANVTAVTFDAAKPETIPDIMRQYKKVGALSFHITPDRQHVVWNYMVGYFNEGGYTYRVVDQGEQARLEFAENLGTWRG